MEALPLQPLSAKPDAGRYELQREIARGGMGAIFVAYDRLAEREVAYKRLLVGEGRGSSQKAALFEREYDALSQLAHPNIVQVYEYGFDHQGPYYTMELLSGADLYQAAPLSIQETCRVVRDLASALSLVHTRRLVHRDVSPLNVRISERGKVKLIDFGALTPFGFVREVVGTPGFVAPECLRSSALNGATDLFSLGAIAYWALLRRAPHRAKSFAELKQRLALSVEPPSTERDDVPEELDELILNLLNNDPLARPESASEVIERITQIGALEPEEEQERVAFSYLRHPPLVGREAELKVIDDVLEKVFRAEGSALLLRGIPGVGRTALLDRISLQAQLGGATVLRGQGGAHRGAFGLASALVRGAIAHQPELSRRTTASLLPDGRVKAGGAPNPADIVDLHARRLSGLLTCLTALSEICPVVILADDIHLADPESLAMLASLAQEVGERPLLLVMTASEARGSNLGALSALREGSRAMPLSVLEKDDVVDLATSVLGGVPNSSRLGVWLHTHSGGNPARAVDLLRSLLQSGRIKYVSGTFALPHDIGDHTAPSAHLDGPLAQLQQVSESARCVAKLLSIQQSAVSLEELSQMSELSGRDLLPAVEELRRRGILWMVDQQTAFVSEALRDMVEHSLETSEKRELHLRVARALSSSSDQSEDAALLAGLHLLRAGHQAEAASLFAGATRSRELGAGNIGVARTQLLELALSVLHRQGREDHQCLGLLVPLAHAGYFRDYRLQLRYLPRTLGLLARRSGMAAAHKLTRFMGARLGLYVGLLSAFVRHLLTRGTKRGARFVDALRDFITLANTAQAASLCAFDFAQAEQILRALEPFSAARKRTAPWFAYQFARASFEVTTGLSRVGGERFAQLLDVLKHSKVRGLDETAFEVYRLGCLYGQAQAELATGSSLPLRLADELLERHAFYASHAESTRMAYFAMRGEQSEADMYRTQAEMAALRGGMSWSAVTILTVRSAYAYMFTRNATGLLRTISELDALTQTVPNLVITRDLARGYLALLRGKHERALRLYERTLADPRWNVYPARWIDRTHYAQVLCAVGRFEEAKHACTLAAADAQDPQTRDIRASLAVQQLALIEAHLGNFNEARAHLERCDAHLRGVDNPLLVGSLHRDCAYVAMLTRDRAAFAQHLDQMSQEFRRTENPWLIRQCEHLAGEAKRNGLVFNVMLPETPLLDEPRALSSLRHSAHSSIVSNHRSESDSLETAREEEQDDPGLTTVIE